MAWCGAPESLWGVTAVVKPMNPDPFGELFTDRFDQNWSKEVEDELLSRAALKRESNTDFRSTVIDSIYFNQSEVPGKPDEADLTKAEIEQIVRERKIT